MNVLAEVLTTWIGQAPCKNIHLICALDGDVSSILYGGTERWCELPWSFQLPIFFFFKKTTLSSLRPVFFQILSKAWKTLMDT